MAAMMVSPSLLWCQFPRQSHDLGHLETHRPESGGQWTHTLLLHYPENKVKPKQLSYGIWTRAIRSLRRLTIIWATQHLVIGANGHWFESQNRQKIIFFINCHMLIDLYYNLLSDLQLYVRKAAKSKVWINI